MLSITSLSLLHSPFGFSTPTGKMLRVDCLTCLSHAGKGVSFSKNKILDRSTSLMGCRPVKDPMVMNVSTLTFAAVIVYCLCFIISSITGLVYCLCFIISSITGLLLVALITFKPHKDLLLFLQFDVCFSDTDDMPVIISVNRVRSEPTDLSFSKSQLANTKVSRRSS